MPRITGQYPFLCHATHRRFRAAHVPAQRGIRTHLVFARGFCSSPGKVPVRSPSKVVMVVVVMIMMALVRSRLRSWWSNKRLSLRVQAVTLRSRQFRRAIHRTTTEAIAFAIAISARAANSEACIEREIRRHILCRVLSIEFRS